jgi:hypothetical protein
MKLFVAVIKRFGVICIVGFPAIGVPGPEVPEPCAQSQMNKFPSMFIRRKY